eukprot:1160114-Pelagomonas_calceolata.AAC.18
MLKSFVNFASGHRAHFCPVRHNKLAGTGHTSVKTIHNSYHQGFFLLNSAGRGPAVCVLRPELVDAMKNALLEACAGSDERKLGFDDIASQALDGGCGCYELRGVTGLQFYQFCVTMGSRRLLMATPAFKCT